MSDSTTKFYAVTIPVAAVVTFYGKADSPEDAKQRAKQEFEANGEKYGDMTAVGELDMPHAEVEELGYKPFNESW